MIRREIVVRIPTGFRLKAQGCAKGATLGQRSIDTTNRNAVAAGLFIPISRGVCRNPVGVGSDLSAFTQGSSFLATLGWRSQSLWDCLNRGLVFFSAASLVFASGCKLNDSDHAAGHAKSCAVREAVILPAEGAAQSGFVREFAPLWDPPTNQVSEALSRLPAVLKHRRWLYSEDSESLSRSVCQAVGLVHTI